MKRLDNWDLFGVAAEGISLCVFVFTFAGTLDLVSATRAGLATFAVGIGVASVNILLHQSDMRDTERKLVDNNTMRERLDLLHRASDLGLSCSGKTFGETQQAIAVQVKEADNALRGLPSPIPYRCTFELPDKSVCGAGPFYRKKELSEHMESHPFFNHTEEAASLDK